MRAAGCNPLKREPSEGVSESQNLKRESKSLILSLELTQRADFATRAYAAYASCAPTAHSECAAAGCNLPKQEPGSRLKRVKNSFLTRQQQLQGGVARRLPDGRPVPCQMQLLHPAAAGGPPGPSAPPPAR